MGVILKWETDEKMPLSAIYFSVIEQEITKVQVRLAALFSSWQPPAAGAAK